MGETEEDFLFGFLKLTRRRIQLQKQLINILSNYLEEIQLIMIHPSKINGNNDS